MTDEYLRAQETIPLDLLLNAISPAEVVKYTLLRVEAGLRHAGADPDSIVVEPFVVLRGYGRAL